MICVPTSLDLEPAGVGYPYNTGPTVDDSFIAAEDIWTFLQLLYQRFPQYTGALHVAGESYAGMYVPHIASVIFKNNKALAKGLIAGHQHVNLTSIILGNGMTDPYYQFGPLYEWYCDGKWRVLDKNGPECARLERAIEVCRRMLKICEEFDSRLTCGPAGAFCFAEIYGSTASANLNPFDVRLKCNLEREDDDCYPEMSWISTYLNKPQVKAQLGIPPENNFTSCNFDIHEKFVESGDAARRSSNLLPELIEDGLRVLVYAGDADLLCPGVTQVLWIENLNTTLQQRFKQAPSLPLWSHGRIAGTTRSAGGKGQVGQIALVQIYDAGHMAPHDQPDAALDVFNRWVEAKQLENGE
ncbi:hypothetical protein FRC09_005970 [Ceratobasidium sp. 395]|nr:hypothetical protein FRC09_005970 [Ceratobasidium sp. 395]